jgi:hypothetical protein
MTRRRHGAHTVAAALVACVTAASAFLVVPGAPRYGRSVRSRLAPHARRGGTRSAKMVGAAGPGGGDLAGGADAARNEQVERLKKMFYKPAEEEELPAAGTIHDLGFLPDMPLCRWSWVLMPGQQLQLNVWQPQYTLMFEKIREPAPPPSPLSLVPVFPGCVRPCVLLPPCPGQHGR